MITKLTLIFLSLWIGMSVFAASDSVWDYHHQRLHKALTVRDWYAAKLALQSLDHRNPQRFTEEGYSATRSWIALQQGHWSTALIHNHPSDIRNVHQRLERALSLQKLGRYKEAVSELNNPALKLKGNDYWQAQSLRALCHESLGDGAKAVSIWRKITRSRAPAAFKGPAWGNLVRFYYSQNNIKKARTLAEDIQAKKPGSDTALYTVELQEARETQKYLDQPSVIQRFSMVYYFNREFASSNHHFARLLEKGNSDQQARARYFTSLTHLKKGQPEKGLDAFRQQMPQLERARYAGPASFQFSRALFMNHYDAEVVDYVEGLQANGDPKWKRESLRLTILALRRLNDSGSFNDLEARLKPLGAGGSIQQFYYRNGVAWAMEDSRYEDALYHLNNYRRFKMKAHERQEATLWEGLIRWELGETEKALDAWLKVASKDPNHYFGLVARQFIQDLMASTGSWDEVWSDYEFQLSGLTTNQIRNLYYMSPPRSHARNELASRLRLTLPVLDLSDVGTSPINREARALAHIGRFDLAARALKKENGASLEYHYLKALWSKRGQDLHRSIRHAEVLTDAWPNWVPYELIPPEIQRLNFPTGFGDIVIDKADDYQVDPFLLLAIIREESRFDVNAKSWASARGLMQFIPDTARETAEEVDGLEDFSLGMLYDPQTAITLGAKYVDHLMETFNGVSLYTVAAYNAGEGAVNRWRGMDESVDPLRFVWDVTYDETKYYCQKVLRAYHHYARVYGQDAETIISAPELQADRPIYVRPKP